MSLQTPTTTEIRDNIIAQLESELSQTIPLLPKSFMRVLATVLAGVFIILYKYCGFMFLQIFVRTAVNEETDINGTLVNPLQEWGALIGVGLPTPSTQAEFVVTITVTNQTGTLPSGTQLIGPTNGVTYITLGAVTLDAPTRTASVRAVSDQSGGGGTGTIGNLEVADTLNFVNPLPNVQQATVIASITVTGANGETTEQYRQRVIDRFQKVPQGGAYADYEQWGEEVEGIINVYPYTGDPGEVDLFSEASADIDPDGIPTSALLQDVLDSVELDSNGLASRRPANAFVNSFPITRTGFDVDVKTVVVDNQAQIELDIEAALDEYFRLAAPFISGLTVPPRTDKITQSGIIGLIEDIVTAASGTFLTATFKLDASGGNITDYTLGQGEKAKTVDVTFTP